MNIPSLCDRALVAWIISNNAGTSDDTRGAKNSELKALPETIVYTHTFEPCRDTPYCGNFDVEVFVEVRTDSVIQTDQADLEDDPRRRNDERVAATFALFLTPIGEMSGEQLGQQITEAARETSSDFSDFTILNCRIIGGNQGFNPKTVRDRGNAWIDTIHLELTVCPKDVL